jgi:glycyl-tRNA synthetase beta chain
VAAHDLLLEIGCEEIPSRLIGGAINQLKEAAAALCAEALLGCDSIDAWGTPRRLTLLVSRLESHQPDRQQKVKGPPRSRAYDSQGQPTEALLGFMRSQGVTPAQVGVETVKDAEYVVALKETAGRPARELLPDLLQRLLKSLSFPRPMYWESKDHRFARPIRWLLALYGTETIPFTFAGITSDRRTYGHRFLSPGPFTADDPIHYFNCLKENGVLLNHNRRREVIRHQLNEAAAACGGEALINDDLLEEIDFLVEYPTAVTGAFDRAYLELPREVLITTMQAHQRYVPVAATGGGNLLPFFIGISNNGLNDRIRKGYEKVLQARLADARFFFDEDRKIPLESYVERLQGVIFQENLGSLDQKRRRLIRLARAIGEKLSLLPGEIERAERAAHLCKADLVTHMVGEFPELQGVMGREYALLAGEPPAVAAAVFEHYLPRFAGDRLPATMEGAIVSLADRIDTLAGCFAAGILPTGSQDPYGLRRQALGLVSILIGRELELAPGFLVEEALEALAPAVELTPSERREVQSSLQEFLNQRLRFVLQEKGLSFDVLEAVLTVSAGPAAELARRAAALQGQLHSAVLAEVATAYNRVANLSRHAQGTAVDPSLFTDPAETGLYRILAEMEPKVAKMLQGQRYLDCLQLFQAMKPGIDRFFDSVLVMAEDEKQRENRLNLLLAVKKLFNNLADFSLLQLSS